MRAASLASFVILWLTDSRMSAFDTDLPVTNNVFFLKESSKYFEMCKSTWFLEVLIKQWVDLDYLANFLALRLTIWKTPKKMTHLLDKPFRYLLYCTSIWCNSYVTILDLDNLITFLGFLRFYLVSLQWKGLDYVQPSK